ncbi:MAG: hypothetical protein ACTS44_01385 [Candidatus Hodgkinia cicadicola]
MNGTTTEVCSKSKIIRKWKAYWRKLMITALCLLASAGAVTLSNGEHFGDKWLFNCQNVVE